MEAEISDHIWTIEELCGLLPETASVTKRIDKRAYPEGSRRTGQLMFVFFSMVVLVALFMFVESAMLVRLTRKGISCDKSPWWRRGYEVATTYEEVFPRSRLPRFRRFVLWLFPA